MARAATRSGIRRPRARRRQDQDERRERERDGLGLHELLLGLLGLILRRRRDPGELQRHTRGGVDERAELVHLVDRGFVGEVEADDDIGGRAIRADEPVVLRLRPADRALDPIVSEQAAERIGDSRLELGERASSPGVPR
jgi:hypothetical protein